MKISNNLTISDEMVSLLSHISTTEKIEPIEAVRRAFALLKIHNEIPDGHELAIVKRNENEIESFKIIK